MAVAKTIWRNAKQNSGEAIWQELMEGNNRFVAGKTRLRDLINLRRNLVESQHPKAVVLACSDSRVSPEIIFDQSLGALFVVRSAGNVLDRVTLGSIEYSVEHLATSVLIVLGHTRCGAVTAACLNQRTTSKSLQAVVDKIRPAVRRVMVVPRREGLLDAAIKENIHRSAMKVLSASQSLSQLAEHGILTVIEAEYILETGSVVVLSQSTEVGDKLPKLVA